MKQCTKCRQSYADDSLFFCLSDGTPLVSPADSPLEETVIRSTPFVFAQPAKQRVSPLLAYSLIAILALIAGGGLVFWLKPGKETSSVSIPKPEISPSAPKPPIEENLDIEGKWVGTFSGKPATFVFNRTENKNKFLGTLTRPPFEIAIAADVGLDARQVIFDEKSVIRGKGWGTLGTSRGSISIDGKSMTGGGRDEHGKSYTWSFSKQ
jgi:hypothetical protein